MPEALHDLLRRAASWVPRGRDGALFAAVIVLLLALPVIAWAGLARSSAPPAPDAASQALAEQVARRMSQQVAPAAGAAPSTVAAAEAALTAVAEQYRTDLNSVGGALLTIVDPSGETFTATITAGGDIEVRSDDPDLPVVIRSAGTVYRRIIAVSTPSPSASPAAPVSPAAPLPQPGPTSFPTWTTDQDGMAERIASRLALADVLSLLDRVTREATLVARNDNGDGTWTMLADSPTEGSAQIVVDARSSLRRIIVRTTNGKTVLVSVDAFTRDPVSAPALDEVAMPSPAPTAR